MTVVPKS